jgi:uncharacterized protein (TIGR02284 family)
MADKTERAILNHLIETCNDAERGFERAAALVETETLKTLFHTMAAERAAFARELVPHAQRLGGPAAAEGTAAAGWHRRWMDVKTRMWPHNDHVVLNEVERGDAVSLRAYVEATNGALPPSMRELIERQRDGVAKSHECLVALCDAPA